MYSKLTIFLVFSAFWGHIQAQPSFIAVGEPDPTSSQHKEKDGSEPQVYNFTVESTVKYRYASTVVTHRVANPANISKEVVFSFTLPENAFISRFVMEIQGKEYVAYVKEKDEAKKVYEEAKASGQSAAHVQLSARASNLFIVSFSLEPQTKGTFFLTYDELLPRSLGSYENVLSIFPGQVVKDLKVIVNIEESSKLTNLQISDLRTENEISDEFIDNKLATVEKSDNKGKIVWSPSEADQKAISEDGVKGQIIVRYDVDRTSQPNQVLIDEGYFVHFFAPEDLETLPKHVTFVLDASGSMSGRKIEQLREAMKLILNETSSDDWFSIIPFSNGIQAWAKNNETEGDLLYYDYQEQRTKVVVPKEKFIIKATKENVEKATEFTNLLDALSGTNIISGLRFAIQLADEGQKSLTKGNEPVIIFLTDGQPNVEMSSSDDIIKTVSGINKNKYPIFSLALGGDADFDFLKKLSLKNSGFARKIYVSSDTSLQLKNFYKEVASPLLVGVNFTYVPSEVDESTVTKTRFPTYFSGGELVVAGKVKAQNISSNITVGGSVKPLICPVVVEWVQRKQGHLEKLWAFMYIKELLDLHSLQDNVNSTYKDKALELSLKYGFVTPLTSLVVVKPNVTELPSSGSGPIPQEESGLLATGLAYPVPSQTAAKYGSPLSISAPAPGIVSAGQWAQYTSPPFYGYSGTTVIPPIKLHDIVDASSATTPVLPLLTAPGSKYMLRDLQWLKHTTDNVTLPGLQGVYHVADPSGVENETFGNCTLPAQDAQESSHCRHISYCITPSIITKSKEDYIPYLCLINNSLLGVCCPDSLPVYTSAEVQ
jgi:uncharacterized protein YegL